MRKVGVALGVTTWTALSAFVVLHCSNVYDVGAPAIEAGVDTGSPTMEAGSADAGPIDPCAHVLPPPQPTVDDNPWRRCPR